MGPVDLLDTENFFPGGDKSVIAVPAESPSIDVLVGVLAIVRFVGSTMNIITISAHPFGVMLLIRMRTVCNFINILGLEYAVQLFGIKHKPGLVNHLIGL